MALFLFRLWPVLIPLLVYVIWMIAVRRKARLKGEPLPHFREGPWFWAVVTSLAIGIVLFLSFGLSHEENKGTYIPPRTVDGKIIPGHIEP